MRKVWSSKASRRLARIALLGAGALALVGCVAPYGFVQPGVPGSGGYYTSESPYAYGYDDYYDAGSYYAVPGYGYYDDYYGGYGYGTAIGLDLGFMGAWGYPGYGGPWYAPSYLDGCWQWGCGGHRWHGHRHHHDGHDPVATAPQRWLKPDHPHIPPSHIRQDNLPAALSERPVEGFARSHRLPSASFAPHDFARVPIRRSMAEHSMGMLPRPIQSLPRETLGFMSRPLPPMPSDRLDRFPAAPRSAARFAPVRSRSHAPSIKRN